MKRAIIAPANLAGPALDELKGWLAITTSGDDPALETLLRGALDMCEGFTGQMPLECTCEEILPASGEWQVLAARPVQAVTAVDGIPAEGPRFALPRPITRSNWTPMVGRACGSSGRAARGGSRCASPPGWRRTGRPCPAESATA